MMVIFHADPHELAAGGALSRQSITIGGIVFPMGVPVDASALPERVKAKLRNNTHFEVVAEAPVAKVSAESAPAVAADDDAEEAAATAAHAERANKRRNKA